MISIRVMTGSDLEFADALRAAEGWNQRPEDWRIFLRADPNGSFIAECDGHRAGTVTTIAYGTELGWIGMMLVHPNFRGRGLGRALMDKAIAHLQSRGVQCIKLDATPLGKRLYEKLGFREESILTRWARSGCNFIAPEPHPPSRALAQSLEIATKMDAAAIGAPRPTLISELMASGRFTVRQGGFGIIRPGSNAAYLGPVVADNWEDAYKIVAKLILVESIIWDVPLGSGGANLPRNFSFAPQRTLTRMYLGENPKSNVPETLFAIAGPEFG